MQNLIENQVIKRFTIDVDTGQGANAMALLSIGPNMPVPRVAKDLKAIKGADVVHEITGQYDICVLIHAPNIGEINRSVDDIRGINGVATTNTVIILRSIR